MDSRVGDNLSQPQKGNGQLSCYVYIVFAIVNASNEMKQFQAKCLKASISQSSYFFFKGGAVVPLNY